MDKRFIFPGISHLLEMKFDGQSLSTTSDHSKPTSANRSTEKKTEDPYRSVDSARQGERSQRGLVKQVSINSGFTLSSDHADHLIGDSTEQPVVTGEEMSPDVTEAGKVPDVSQKQSTYKKMISSSLLGENVHSSYSSKKEKAKWRHIPLFDRAGFKPSFQTGLDAASLLMQELRRRDPYQGEFLDAVDDIVNDIAPAIEENPKRAWIFKQLMEPEYFYTFRVPWKDDNLNSRINRGYLCQYSSSLGTYNGGIVFSQTLSHGQIRMLGWEQTLRNSLAGTAQEDISQNALFGGLKCGSDFDPEEKSEEETRRFCQSYMNVLYPLLASNKVPSMIELDTKVGKREIQFLKEAYDNNVEALPAKQAKHQLFGSSSIFPECKGYGCAYFAESAVANHLDEKLSSMNCIVSGSGLLSRNIARKLLQLGAKPLTLSDDSGVIYAANGLTEDCLFAVEQFRQKNLPLRDFAKTQKNVAQSGIEFIPDGNIFRHGIEADLVFASGGRGEMNVDDATAIEDLDVIGVFECLDGAVTTNARVLLADRNVLFASAKSASAGTLVASGFLQKYQEKHGTDKVPAFSEVEENLRTRMHEIEREISQTAEDYNLPGNLKAGANILSFLKIAEKESLPPDGNE